MIAALLLLVASTALPQETIPKDLKALQGRWLLQTVNGQAVDASAPEAVFTIAGDKYAHGPDANAIERGTLKVDPSKPLEITLVIATGESAGSSQVGIYDATADTLRFHLNVPGATERPKDFTAREGFLLLTLTKQKETPR